MTRDPWYRCGCQEAVCLTLYVAGNELDSVRGKTFLLIQCVRWEFLSNEVPLRKTNLVIISGMILKWRRMITRKFFWQGGEGIGKA